MQEPLSLSAGITVVQGGGGDHDDTADQRLSLQQQPQHQYSTTFPSSYLLPLPHAGGRRFTTTIVVEAVENHHHHHDTAAAAAALRHHQQQQQQQHEQAHQQQQQQHHPIIEHQQHERHQPLVHHVQHQGNIIDYKYTSLGCGLLAGVAQAGLLNPYDRALFLSVTHHRPFLSIENWQAPYTGFVQSMSGRALQGGLYFPLEQFFLSILSDVSSTSIEHNNRLHFMAGTAAGAVNALILNPLSAFKYKTWGQPSQTRGSIWTRAIVGMRLAHKQLQLQMRGSNQYATTTTATTGKTAKISPFLWNGLAPTLYRDVVFGGCYTCLRWQIRDYLQASSSSHEMHHHHTSTTATWYANLIAAGLATILSGPFNYARNIQYATPSASRERPLSTITILQNLVQETRQHNNPGRFLQNRLQLGWGTARVAFGISLGHGIYDWLLLQAQAQHHEQQ